MALPHHRAIRDPGSTHDHHSTIPIAGLVQEDPLAVVAAMIAVHGMAVTAGEARATAVAVAIELFRLEDLDTREE